MSFRGLAGDSTIPAIQHHDLSALEDAMIPIDLADASAFARNAPRSSPSRDNTSKRNATSWQAAADAVELNY